MYKTPKQKLKETEVQHRRWGYDAKLDVIETTNSNSSVMMNKEFEFTCTYRKLANSEALTGIATARTKKAAEHGACQKVLDLLKEEDNSTNSKPVAIVEQGITGVNISTTRIETKVTSKIVYYADNLVGEGGFAKVYEGYFETPTRKAAVKICSKEFNHYEKTKELDIMRKLDHPNVVTYYTTEDIGPYTYIVMEFANSTLEDVINTNPCIDLQLCHKWTVESTKGLIALHESKIVHRDLKPSNVLIFPTNVAKLADFGISKELDSFTQGVVTEAARGTRMWMPTEVLDAVVNKSRPPFKLLPTFDIFSLGLTIAYTMTRGIHLFADRKDEATLQIEYNILHYRPNWVWLAGNEWTSLKHLLQSLIHQDPTKRTNANIAVEHPFFWDKKRGLELIMAVVNDIKNTETDGKGLEEMYKRFCLQANVTPNWRSRLCTDMQSFMSYKDTMRAQKKGYSNQLKKYNEFLFLKLIEFIRDYNQHYKDWDQFDGGMLKRENVFGRDGSNYAHYFVTKYPELTTVLYAYFQDSKYHGLQLPEFYNLNRNDCFSKW